MTKVMTPSETITPGQIGKFQELLGAALRKSDLQSALVQQVLEHQANELVNGMVAALRSMAEKIGHLFSRTVTVDRSCSPQARLDATGRTQYTDRKVVDGMPRGQGSEAEVFFFKLGRYVSDVQLEKEYDLRGLEPVDPYSLAAVNKADPVFADEHPNGTHWKNAEGKWCFAAFDRWFDERDVRVGRRVDDWDGYWWFAGVRK